MTVPPLTSRRPSVKPPFGGSAPAGPRWPLTELWLAIVAWCSLSGWILSALGLLNRSGYTASILLGLMLLSVWWRSRTVSYRGNLRRFIAGWKRRRRRPLPLIFAGIFVLATIGGLLYPPNNFDALTYRLPQTLHWLDAGRWHWIATTNNHFNITGAGYSWLMAPLLALTRSDRAFFLPNIVAFAFLPGLFFSVTRQLGAGRRVAWFWMWILPTGYCFALQAGGIANDLLPAVYLLAAVALALRCRHSGSILDAWFSIVAAALATGVKVVVLPLGLPWLVAFAPCWRTLLRKPAGTALVILASLSISFLPTAILNARHTGDWAGDPANSVKLRIDSPLHGVAGNALEIASANLAPPIWPIPAAVNSLFTRFADGAIGQAIIHKYPRFDMRWFEMVTEDGAGIGLGIVVLAATSLIAAGVRRRASLRSTPNWNGWIFGAASVVAAVAYGTKMGSEAAPRLMAAYYPFLLVPVLLLPVQQALTRFRWWRILAVLCAASIVPALALAPARPLWPAQTVLSHLAVSHPNNSFVHRVRRVYETFAQRHDYLAPLKKWIPADAVTVGFVPTGNDLESSLWQPFGSRRVVEVLTPSRSDPAIRQLSGSIIVCSPRGLDEHFQMNVDEFCAAVGARIAGQETLTLKAAVGPEKWYVIAME